MSIDLAWIDGMTGGRLGEFDMPCPICSPLRRHANQRKPVLRVWRVDPGFATYCCAHCAASGHTRDVGIQVPDRAAIERAKAEAAERARLAAADRLDKALWLWRMRQPIGGTIAAAYLRQRGYDGSLPGTIGFLPGRGAHGPAMIAGFGLPLEIEPGRIRLPDDHLRGVHITRLAADGLGKAGTDNDKVMVGLSAGWPIVLAAPNDLLGLAIAEGIEDGLSAHAFTGLGAWASGGAKRLPPLADVIPGHVEAVRVMADADADGVRFARILFDTIRGRVPDARLVLPLAAREAA